MWLMGLAAGVAFFVSVAAGVISHAAMARPVTVGERSGLACVSVTGSSGSLVVPGVPGAGSCRRSSLALGSLLAAELRVAQGPGAWILWLFTSPGCPLLRVLGSRCCARAGTGLSRDPLCSFLISCGVQ